MLRVAELPGHTILAEHSGLDTRPVPLLERGATEVGQGALLPPGPSPCGREDSEDSDEGFFTSMRPQAGAAAGAQEASVAGERGVQVSAAEHHGALHVPGTPMALPLPTLGSPRVNPSTGRQYFRTTPRAPSAGSSAAPPFSLSSSTTSTPVLSDTTRASNNQPPLPNDDPEGLAASSPIPSYLGASLQLPAPHHHHPDHLLDDDDASSMRSWTSVATSVLESSVMTSVISSDETASDDDNAGKTAATTTSAPAAGQWLMPKSAASLQVGMVVTCATCGGISPLTDVSLHRCSTTPRRALPRRGEGGKVHVGGAGNDGDTNDTAVPSLPVSHCLESTVSIVPRESEGADSASSSSYGDGDDNSDSSAGTSIFSDDFASDDDGSHTGNVGIVHAAAKVFTGKTNEIWDPNTLELRALRTSPSWSGTDEWLESRRQVPEKPSWSGTDEWLESRRQVPEKPSWSGTDEWLESRRQAREKCEGSDAMFQHEGGRTSHPINPAVVSKQATNATAEKRGVSEEDARTEEDKSSSESDGDGFFSSMRNDTNVSTDVHPPSAGDASQGATWGGGGGAAAGAAGSEDDHDWECEFCEKVYALESECEEHEVGCAENPAWKNQHTRTNSNPHENDPPFSRQSSASLRRPHRTPSPPPPPPPPPPPHPSTPLSSKVPDTGVWARMKRFYDRTPAAQSMAPQTPSATEQSPFSDGSSHIGDSSPVHYTYEEGGGGGGGAVSKAVQAVEGQIQGQQFQPSATESAADDSDGPCETEFGNEGKIRTRRTSLLSPKSQRKKAEVEGEGESEGDVAGEDAHFTREDNVLSLPDDGTAGNDDDEEEEEADVEIFAAQVSTLAENLSMMLHSEYGRNDARLICDFLVDQSTGTCAREVKE